MQEFLASQIPSAAMHLCGYIADLAFDLGKARFKDKVDEHKLRSAIENFIENHRKYNEICSLAEEIDFEGLAQYLRSDLLSDISNRVFHPDKKIRGKARQEIINKAVLKSNANTKEAKERVRKLIGIILDIIRSFYKDKISRKDWILASGIVGSTVDGVSELIDSSNEAVMDAIKSSEEKLSAKIDLLQSPTQKNSPFSLDAYYAMSANGDIGGVIENLQMVADICSRNHPLYPNYGYKISDNRLQSIPLTADATIKYPPNFSCSAKIAMGGQTLDHLDKGVIDYADRHQLPITITVDEAEKLLGSIHDPDQAEAERLIGQTITRKPKEFPPAFPCKLIMNGEVMYDYLEMRTAEILDDGTYVVDNREQKNCHFRIQIQFRVSDVRDEENITYVKKPSFNIKQDTPTNKDTIKFLRFLKMSLKGSALELFALNHQKNILAGNLEPFTYETEFNSIEDEIDIAERLCILEEFLGREISPPNQIAENEYKQLLYISSIIRGEEVTIQWQEAHFKRVVDDDFRKRIAKLTDEYHPIVLVGAITTKLFCEEFEIPIMRKYRCCKIKDLDRLKKKVEYADNGDEIKFTYIPGEDNTYIDRLKPEDLDRQIEQ